MLYKECFMKIHFRLSLYAVLIFLLLCQSSYAVDKESPDYGVTHKDIFNDPENCTLCHMQDNFGGEPAPHPPEPPPDIYEEEEDGGLFGWFFTSETVPIADHTDLSAHVFESYERSGFISDPTILPHDFIAPITGMCSSSTCHTEEELGNSHAVEIAVTDRYPDMRVPTELPLYWDTDKYQSVISCGTCHNPHLDWLSRDAFSIAQEVTETIEGADYYTTFFIRVRSPETGLFVLCKGCHNDY